MFKRKIILINCYDFQKRGEHIFLDILRFWSIFHKLVVRRVRFYTCLGAAFNDLNFLRSSFLLTQGPVSTGNYGIIRKNCFKISQTLISFR